MTSSGTSWILALAGVDERLAFEGAANAATRGWGSRPSPFRQAEARVDLQRCATWAPGRSRPGWALRGIPGISPRHADLGLCLGGCRLVSPRRAGSPRIRRRRILAVGRLARTLRTPPGARHRRPRIRARRQSRTWSSCLPSGPGAERVCDPTPNRCPHAGGSALLLVRGLGGSSTSVRAAREARHDG